MSTPALPDLVVMQLWMHVGWALVLVCYLACGLLSVLVRRRSRSRAGSAAGTPRLGPRR